MVNKNIGTKSGFLRNKILGYTDKLTVRPGDEIQFKVSSENNLPYKAQLVKLINGDIYTEDGANYREVELESSINGVYPGRYQSISAGSGIIVNEVTLIEKLDAFTLSVNVMPTIPMTGKQHLISRWNEETKTGWSLQINDQGQFSFVTAANSNSLSSFELDHTVVADCWYTVCLRVDWLSGRIQLNCQQISTVPLGFNTVSMGLVGQKLIDRPPPSSLPLIMAGAFSGCDIEGDPILSGCFNGRLEAPVLYKGIISDTDVEKVSAGERPTLLMDYLVADWDFSDGISCCRIIDKSNHQTHGEVHNLPLRGVRGSRWDGSAMEWPQAPKHYAAIHFHADDLYDCKWSTDISYELPDTLSSGIYALRLRQSNGEDSSHDSSDRKHSLSEDYLPFFVAAPKNKPQAKLAFIVPTFTYVAYGNIQGIEVSRKEYGVPLEEHYTKEMLGPGMKDYALRVADHFDLGLSLYDRHSDGTPVHTSSWHRPLLNMRPKSILWNLCADLLIIDWLEAKNIDYDIITDDLLQEEGVDLLKNYNVIMSGNHPEYPTTEQLDALQSYLNQGGRFMYMGGNGYYWRSAVHQELAGVIEVRRGQTGTGTWQSDVGEDVMSFSGEPGGIWRDLGRPPQELFGVGFIAQGTGESYYRVRSDVREGRASFILDGVDGDIFGESGVFGAIVAQEIDQTNKLHGTPEHAIIIARSEDHGDDMVYVIEEMMSVYPVIDHYRPNTYAEAVFFETLNGGAVFSTGSMGWCGGLGDNRYQNDVSRITINVLNRFCDEAPFPHPLCDAGDRRTV